MARSSPSQLRQKLRAILEYIITPMQFLICRRQREISKISLLLNQRIFLEISTIETQIRSLGYKLNAKMNKNSMLTDLVSDAEGGKGVAEVVWKNTVEEMDQAEKSYEDSLQDLMASLKGIRILILSTKAEMDLALDLSDHPYWEPAIVISLDLVASVAPDFLYLSRLTLLQKGAMMG